MASDQDKKLDKLLKDMYETFYTYNESLGIHKARPDDINPIQAANDN